MEKNNIDPRFYTSVYELTDEEKRMLAELSSSPHFRVFEKYLDIRVNNGAHRMKKCLVESKPHDATLEAAEIDALVKITKDMKQYWDEMEREGLKLKKLQLGNRPEKAPKLTGNDKVDILSEFINEIEPA